MPETLAGRRLPAVGASAGIGAADAGAIVVLEGPEPVARPARRAE